MCWICFIQILLNGCFLQVFKPKRGIRQGNPLSPYLFVIVSELLSRILTKAESEGKISGFNISKNAPSFSHILYVDNLIIFLENPT